MNQEARLPAAVSVVVAVHNAEQTVEECARSLLAQQYPRPRLEIVFVDNGSTDATPSILARLAGEAGIRVLREPRRGRSVARNTGWRNARHDVIAVTDGDCIADPGWLREIVPAVAPADVGQAGGSVLAKRPCNRVEAFGETIHDAAKAIRQDRPPYVITGNMACRREVLDRVGGFDEALIRGEDTDLSWRIIALGYRLVHAPAAIVYHRNERTHWGLLRQGIAHGYSSPPLLARHAPLLKASGIRQPGSEARAIYASTAGLLRGTHGEHARYQFVFELGKSLGRLLRGHRAGGALG